jgi:hypothetical protein
MNRKFEYDLSVHPEETFKELVYFCGPTKQCSAERIPADQLQILSGILNERGQDGWELVQLSFGDNGVVAIWKRELP